MVEKHRKDTEPMESVSTKQQRIAQAARRHEQVTTLGHHVDVNWLWEAYRRVNRHSAPGVDGMKMPAFEEGLMDRLRDLEGRLKSGSYKAPPVRRAHIPKNQHETRPIGLPTIEDKIAQHAVVMLLEPIYEGDFHPFSYGFRPGRGAHQALEYLRTQCFEQRVGWILEVDLRKFFDTLGHAHLREMLRRRVRDGVVLRLIDKWLKAGVMEEGQLSYSEAGTPQGGVISPLLANVYLHEALDDWYVKQWSSELKGRHFLVRYADDFVMGFEHREDAERTLEALRERMQALGLQIHPEKTRLLPFKRPASRSDGNDEPGSFDFLGFTHYWARSLAGHWVVKKKTASKRFSRALSALRQWGWKHRHLPLREQWEHLCAKLRGHDAYYGIVGNSRALSRLRHELKRAWRAWLSRRSRERALPWSRFNRMLARMPLPSPRIHRHIPTAANLLI